MLHPTIANSPLAKFPGRKYVYGQLNVENTGVGAYFTLYQPNVSLGDSSSVALWVSKGNGSNMVALEVGVMVNPSKFKSNKPVLYVHWTKDGYQKSGGYNIEVPGFVPLLVDNQTVGIGQPADEYFKIPITPYQPARPATGFQVSIINLKIRRIGTYWWFIAGGVYVGYWPAATLGFKSTDTFTSVQWGGEVFSPTNNIVQMGSGHIASEGFGRACAMGGQHYFDAAGSQTSVFNATGNWLYSTSITSSCYTLGRGRTNGVLTSPMYFGGPLLGTTPQCSHTR